MHTHSIEDFRHAHVFLGEAHTRNERKPCRAYLTSQSRSNAVPVSMVRHDPLRAHAPKIS